MPSTNRTRRLAIPVACIKRLTVVPLVHRTRSHTEVNSTREVGPFPTVKLSMASTGRNRCRATATRAQGSTTRSNTQLTSSPNGSGPYNSRTCKSMGSSTPSVPAAITSSRPRTTTPRMEAESTSASTNTRRRDSKGSLTSRPTSML